MSYETNDKMVSHPDHYQSGKYEVIDIIDEFTKDLRGTEAVCTANAIKYILRWKKKNGIQDVKKAIWYLQHMVDKEEERLREEAVEYDGPDEHCRTCKFRFNTPENDKICLNCFGREKYVRDETFEEKKLEPGCDKCEISECKFLEDPFMNPPYNELWSQWKAQKEIINDLLRDKKEMQDSIDVLTNKENADIEELEQAVNFQREEIKQLKIEKHEILMDLKCLIYDDLNNYSYMDENSNRPDIVHKACIRAGIDVQKKKDRYFKENDKEIQNEQG